MAETEEYVPAVELQNAINGSITEDNEELSRILRERFQRESSEQGDGSEGGDVGEPDPGSPPPPATDTPTPPEPETPTPPTIPEVIDFGEGLQLSREQAREYAEFAQFLADNPEYAQLARQAFEATAAPPTPITPPEELDLDDPTIKFLWDRMQEQDTRYADAIRRIEELDAYASTQTSATTESLVNRAVTSFQQQHNFSDADMNTIRSTAARLEILPALMAPIDPISGQARRVDPLAAIESSLEIAMNAIPEYRDRALALQVEQYQKEETKKRNLSKLGGSSGSVPRTTPVPTTKEARQQAMIAELADMIHGPGQSNEES